MRGVTLIELIIVMVMIGILAAISVPIYTDYIRRSTRAAAQEYLIALAARQTQWYLDRRAYTDVTTDLLGSAPTQIANKYTVAIAVTAGPPATYTITATPTGSQSVDRCGNLTIDQTGARGTSTSATGCW